MSPITVRVDLSARGVWEIVLPGQPERVRCETLDEARQMAYRCAGERRPCELIVCDAYHRVVHHELIDGDAADARGQR
jgi:hypothetical protein